MEKLYRIEELTTEGWTLLDNQAVNLTKDQCDVKLRVAQDTTPHIETDEEYAKRVASLPEKPDTPDIDSIQERNYENRRT